jgi:hypothetical protein
MTVGRYSMRGWVFQPWAFAGRALANSGIVPVVKYGRQVAGDVYQSRALAGQVTADRAVAGQVYQSAFTAGQVQ